MSNFLFHSSIAGGNTTMLQCAILFKNHQKILGALLNKLHTSWRVLPAYGGELGLLLHLLCKDLQLLLERLFVVVGVDVVVVWHHRWQELGTGEAEQLFKHLQVSEMEKATCVITAAGHQTY